MILAFPPSAFEVEPFEVELIALKNSFRWSKVLLHQRVEKLFDCDLSQDVKKKKISVNESFITFSFILESRLR